MNPIYKQNLSLRRTLDLPRNIKAIILVATIKIEQYILKLPLPRGKNNALWPLSLPLALKAGEGLKIKQGVILMLKDLGVKSIGATSIVKRYMNPTKLYKKQYEF